MVARSSRESSETSDSADALRGQGDMASQILSRAALDSLGGAINPVLGDINQTLRSLNLRSAEELLGSALDGSDDGRVGGPVAIGGRTDAGIGGRKEGRAEGRVEGPVGDGGAVGDKVFLVHKKGCSDRFARQAEQTMERMPVGVQHLLESNGYTVVAAKSVTEASPELKGVRPRGWPPGTTWDDSDGTTDGKGKRIIVAERFRHEGKWITNPRTEAVLRHETGHAVDDSLGKGGVNFSSSAEFKAAYEKDLKAISAADQKKLQYHLQPGAAGREETFADVFALLMGGPSNEHQRARLERAFPEVAKLIQKKVAELK